MIIRTGSVIAADDRGYERMTSLTRARVMVHKLSVVHRNSRPSPLHDHVYDVMQQGVAGSTGNGLQNLETNKSITEGASQNVILLAKRGGGEWICRHT